LNIINKKKKKMKKIVLLLITIFSLNIVVEASFPVTNNNVNAEVVLSQSNESNPLAPPVEFHFGGFILGLLLGIIGVGLAYIFSSDAAFRRNAWYGFGTWMIIWLLLVAPAM
jgi:hypothetical protein